MHTPLLTRFRLGLFLAVLMNLMAGQLQAQDATSPTVLSHQLSSLVSPGPNNVRATRLVILFDEPLDATLAGDVSHYQINGSTVTGATVKAGGRKVVLGLEPAPVSGSAYSLAVSGLTDVAGNPLAATNLTGTAPYYETDWALQGLATQSSSRADEQGLAQLAVDGDIDGFFANGSVTLNDTAEDGWWEVDLLATRPIGRVEVWFRTLTAQECQDLFNACGVRNDDFQIVILDSGRNEVFRRRYPGRPPSPVGYNLPSGVTGRYVRFEAQKPRTTSDGYFSLAEVAVVAPYEGAGVTVTQQPASTNTVEGLTASFGPVAASVTGAPQSRLQVQWQVNGNDIVGANNAIYVTPPRQLSDNGSIYRAVFLLPGVAVPSADAVLGVQADRTPPGILSVVPGAGLVYVTVTFTEPVGRDEAADVFNYSLSDANGLLDLSGVVQVSATTYRVSTPALTPGATYTLKVIQVRDLASGGGNEIAPNTTKTFTVSGSAEDRFVTVGNPGNAPDQVFGPGRGAVNYVYQIGKYEVNNAEYAAFLNARAKTDPNTLWDSRMHIARSGDEGGYSYTVESGWEKKPVYYVAAVDAMRYVNWLGNGASDDSDTETGTYMFTGYATASGRSPTADYYLPNDDEWYKAAYYDPTKDGTGGYWLYPSRTSDPGVLSFQQAPGDQFAVCFVPAPSACDEDAFPLASSYYGTFHQAGNVWEWNERPSASAARTRRSGGSWGNNSARVAASVNADNDIGNGGQSDFQGFRVARGFRPRPELVTVGNPGNPADQIFSPGRGAVGYVYQIGKYEVNNTEYAAFLNAKARSDTNSLWDSRMRITRSGDDGAYTYVVLAGSEKKPVQFVAAVDAMRFVNWLNNGGTANSDTETGSYQFAGYSAVGGRLPAGRIVLPNDNEWYKAAYYDPNKDGTGGYWLYPTRTSDPNVLNFQAPPGDQFTVCFLPATEPCDGDAFTLASSYFGTYHQAGNVWEWNEPVRPESGRTRRSGGSWGNNSARLAASVNADNDMGNGGQSEFQGFRIAQVDASGGLVIVREGNFGRIQWTGGGALESAPSLQGPWTRVDGATASPFSVPLNAAAARFFRTVR